MSREEDLVLVREAFHGQRGADMHLIASVGLSIVATLLRKNTDYGNSAFDEPELAPGVTALQGIQCRMSDKVKRLRRLLAGSEAKVAESAGDSMLDLAGYSILWVALSERLSSVKEAKAGSAPEASAEVSGSIAFGGQNAGPAFGHCRNAGAVGSGGGHQ